jgi:hypothetical protein
MNYPYSSLILEAQRAKQRLGRALQARPDRRAGSLSLPSSEGAPARNDQQNAASRPRVSPKVLRPRNGLGDARRKTAFPNRPYWTRKDMGALSFTLTLLLLGTATAAQTDRPVLWLSVGPAPLAVAFAAAAFLRRRFNLCACVRGLRNRGRQGRERPAHTESCQCQCQ